MPEPSKAEAYVYSELLRFLPIVITAAVGAPSEIDGRGIGSEMTASPRARSRHCSSVTCSTRRTEPSGARDRRLHLQRLDRFAHVMDPDHGRAPARARQRQG